MIFQEFYGAYYNSMANILAEAVQHPLNRENMIQIIEQHAFSESAIAILDAIKQQNWKLLLPDGTTPLQHVPDIPLSLLQRRWLKSMLMDKRIQLFIPDSEVYLAQLNDISPLFTDADYYVFDRYEDGDHYTDETYIRNFRMILDAIHQKQALKIIMRNRSGIPAPVYVMPQYLEYSEKDDKFRLIASDGRMGKVINLARILSCSQYDGAHMRFDGYLQNRMETVTMELLDERNALERVLMHFAHFEKTVKQLDKKCYQITLSYNQDDESELVIRILSFGPMIQVTAPETFRERIKERLKKQKSIGIC